jgi:putative DNA primase/helicase
VADRSDGGNRQRAGDIWRAAVDPRDTLAHVYLEHRGLDLPDEVAGEAIRFHPACPMGEEHHPAMVCLVRSIATNEPQAIHRTALSSDGIEIKRSGKTFRMSLGPVSAARSNSTPTMT